MSDFSNTSYAQLSDSAIEKNIGRFIRHTRQSQNKTQQELADAAGISRSTLSLLERGESGTISTLIQLLRVLDRLDIFKAFEVKSTISPLLLAEQEQKTRQRVRKKSGDSPPEPTW